MRLMTVLILTTTMSASAPSSAYSDEPSSDGSESAQTIQGFAQTNPTCVDFTDQCSICSQESGELVCSTPKIACIKRELQCTKLRAVSVEK